jgi:hypothetical protein
MTAATATVLSNPHANSPQALARVIALGIVSDACVDPREFDALENLGAFAAIGVSRDEFKQIARDLYAELIGAMRASNSIELLTPDRVDAVLAVVDDPALRLKAFRYLAAVISADGRFNDSEFDLFALVLRRWLPLDGRAAESPPEHTLPEHASLPAVSHPIYRPTASLHPALHAD